MLALALEKCGTVAGRLAGGSTPRPRCERLAELFDLERLTWARTHWSWGDERFAPHNDASSNHRMAQEALQSRAPIPRANLHAAPRQGLDPDDADAAATGTAWREGSARRRSGVASVR